MINTGKYNQNSARNRRGANVSKIASISNIPAPADAKKSTDPKRSILYVDVISDTNQTLSGFATIDGFLTSIGDRILLVNQTTVSENGVYIAGLTVWDVTSDDFDLSPVIRVLNGDVYSNSLWLQDGVPVDSNALTFRLIVAHNPMVSLQKTITSAELLASTGVADYNTFHTFQAPQSPAFLFSSHISMEFNTTPYNTNQFIRIWHFIPSTGARVLLYGDLFGFASVIDNAMIVSGTSISNNNYRPFVESELQWELQSVITTGDSDIVITVPFYLA